MDVLAPFFAASGLQPHIGDSDNSSADVFQPPIDRIAPARTAFPLVAVAIDDPSTTDVDDAISYRTASLTHELIIGCTNLMARTGTSLR